MSTFDRHYMDRLNTLDYGVSHICFVAFSVLAVFF